jgi:hypothetical protein
VAQGHDKGQSGGGGLDSHRNLNLLPFRDPRRHKQAEKTSQTDEIELSGNGSIWGAISPGPRELELRRVIDSLRQRLALAEANVEMKDRLISTQQASLAEALANSEAMEAKIAEMASALPQGSGSSSREHYLESVVKELSDHLRTERREILVKEAEIDWFRTELDKWRKSDSIPAIGMKPVHLTGGI